MRLTPLLNVTLRLHQSFFEGPELARGPRPLQSLLPKVLLFILV